MPHLMIKILTTLTNNIVSFEQLGPDLHIKVSTNKDGDFFFYLCILFNPGEIFILICLCPVYCSACCDFTG